ncbi:MAG: DUF4396 domain-containing protein [Candidatus Woesearchaeota archaeon]|nr:DUF4396 domain-containing protein [Candidatus Woesearchaeota archaeon]
MSYYKLAASTTAHCLLGCGLGEVVGVLIGVSLGWATWQSITLGVSLGFVFGFFLGILPLKKRGKTVKEAFKIIALGEVISISVMEATEVLIQIYTPGVMDAGFSDPILWFGMLLALTGGYIAAYPVNLLMIKKGVPRCCH